MPSRQELDALLSRLEQLLLRQDTLTREVENLREEIYQFKHTEDQAPSPESQPITTGQSSDVSRETTEAADLEDQLVAPVSPKRRKQPSDLEKFIGENLINKIGIIITILGAGIGTKYAIDHDLISPLTRIILGYLLGLGLFGFAVRLKKNYPNFSAVLLSGAMAIMYLITYAAYSFYGLIPQAIAFGMMVVFTVFTVVAALRYNKQVIAHIGLVGAYAVPFLLSPEEGDPVVLFSYVAIINLGILAIAFRRSWKPLYYAAFGFTWLIYLTWFLFDQGGTEDFIPGMAFATTFFLIFYAIFLAYKLLNRERFGWSDILVLLSNSFLLYGFGYALLDDQPGGDQWQGLFTVANALMHAGVSVLVFRQKLDKRDLFYFISGLFLVFVTISIPVQLNGNWVTMLWAGEAALLFWVGRTQQAGTYEKLGYALLFLAFFSLLHDWTHVYDVYDTAIPESRIPFLFNVPFLTSLLCMASFGTISYLLYSGRFPSPFTAQTETNWVLRGMIELLSFTVPFVLVITIYGAIMVELETFWDQRYLDSARTLTGAGADPSTLLYNEDLKGFKTIWEINYSALFLSVLSIVNMRFVRNGSLAAFNLLANILLVWVFLTLGLFVLGDLSESFITREHADTYQIDAYHIGIRYISFLFLALLMTVSYRYTRDALITMRLHVFFELILHIVILWIASSELIQWMDLAQSTQSDKLGLSILWGSYALLLIVLGIWKQKKYLRITAILLFGGTLVKLFFYDLVHLDTISKTIVFVALGVLLLIISFLYQKYRKKIFDAD